MMRYYLPLGLALVPILGMVNQNEVIAQTSTNTVEIAAWPTNDWSFWPNDDDQAPQRTVSGASRDSCSNHQMIPLLPESQHGFTSKSHPEILVATSVNTPRQVLFIVQSESGYYYETYLDLPETPGIVSIRLPDEAPALADNELYQWSLIMMCNDKLRPDSPALHGWIRLQVGESNSYTENSLEQAVTYHNDYLWYDMIAMLADLRRQDPDNQDVYYAWQSTLEGADLESVANAPILE
ncbi:MAG: DUF928 domain-containing protein [Cyanobacteria bacterium P01_D01_bin.56]